MAVVTLKNSRRAKSAQKKIKAPVSPSSPEDSAGEIQGKPLLDLLWVEVGRKGHTTHDLAEALGVAYPYLMALARGERKLPSVSREFLVNAAGYLNIPVAQAYILSGALKPTDFYHEDTLQAEIANLYDAIGKHPHWCGFLPSKKTWAGLPKNVKLLIGMFFERVTGKTFFRYAEMESEK
ncbi:MAG: helix-turn-helix transcriptional regulator [Rhodocyclaceae bacterium]|nr:helix-turn-helix transcriptional regulator [Rhodocyclaceae bacterium]